MFYITKILKHLCPKEANQASKKTLKSPVTESRQVYIYSWSDMKSDLYSEITPPPSAMMLVVGWENCVPPLPTVT